MKKQIKEYLSMIGKIGGKRSKRRLTSEQAKAMVCARKAKRAQLGDAQEKSLTKGSVARIIEE